MHSGTAMVRQHGQVNVNSRLLSLASASVTALCSCVPGLAAEKETNVFNDNEFRKSVPLAQLNTL